MCLGQSSIRPWGRSLLGRLEGKAPGGRCGRAEAAWTTRSPCGTRGGAQGQQRAQPTGRADPGAKTAFILKMGPGLGPAVVSNEQDRSAGPRLCQALGRGHTLPCPSLHQQSFAGYAWHLSSVLT